MNARPSRSEVLMEKAFSTAKRSTCNRLHVGAIVAREGRDITSGYNGPPSGFPHCEHEDWEGSCKLAVHAERNAIDFAARYGGHGTDAAELFVTHSPCHDCAKDVIQAGIICVYYAIPFRDTHGLDLLNYAGIEVIRLAIPENGPAHPASDS